MHCVKCVRDVLWSFGTKVVALKQGKIYKNIGKKDVEELVRHNYAVIHEERIHENKMLNIEYSNGLPHTKVYNPEDDEDGDEIDLLEVEKEMEEDNFDGSQSIAKKRGKNKKVA